MAEITLSSSAELFAEKAEQLRAFSGLKLLHVKREVAAILAQIGRNGIFDEYTKHDISHIDRMLSSLDDIIPESTKDKLTSSDWLMVTLAIYLHDLGMLVTKEEFKERGKTEFPKYKESVLNGVHGADYRDKILAMDGVDAQDRFLYQELVRKTHAERIKYWILEEVHPIFNVDLPIVKEIKKLLGPADYMFRRDLALICESHHLSDLEDFEKYKPNQQYGTSKSEVVNLHYAALILRTADLLHITSDRTPSIEFSLINPTDPISQEEWAKQRAVRAIRPQAKKNTEGALDNSITKDTFEVIALFEHESGFFGLISYLNYASKQLKENFKFNEIAKKQFGTLLEYPWKHIDDSSIEAKDFEKRQFEFVLDQTKILDLLVGHTLYNDSTVVLRELIQNGIDAVKLKRYQLENEGGASLYSPEIKIKWSQKERELSFADNGTGMTLEIIQNHLLKVGSSRYQDENFKKKFPGFSPISRFGIGLLTCFLIADDLDIITKSSENEKAILLKVKKVHGKYLLKYFNADVLPESIRPHGTVVKLFVRSDVNLNQIERDIKRWILVPNCKLVLDNNGKEISIGMNSPAELLRSYLESKGYDIDGKNFAIKEFTKEGITLAVALRYLEHWNEWEFIQYSEAESFTEAPIGTCIEGIRVDFNSPGFMGRNLFAVLNTTGKHAPKTNVARSNIELTPEREYLLLCTYQLLLLQISDELRSLRKNFSITWAANEVNWLLRSFSSQRRYNPDARIEDLDIYEKALSEIECILIEKKESRKLISIDELKGLGYFWTIDCASYSSADSLIKEAKSTNTSALALLNTIFGKDESKIDHIDNLLCIQYTDQVIDKIISDNFQVDSMRLIPEQRRLDLRWKLTREKLWEEIKLDEEEFSRSSSRCYVQLKDIEIDKSVHHTAINSSNALFILKNSELNTYLIKLIEKLHERTEEDMLALSKTVGLLNGFFYYRDFYKVNIEELIQHRFERDSHRDLAEIVWSRVDKQELIGAIMKTNFVKYDTTIWARRDQY